MTGKMYPILELAVTLFLVLGRVLSQYFTEIIKNAVCSSVNLKLRKWKQEFFVQSKWAKHGF